MNYYHGCAAVSYFSTVSHKEIKTLLKKRKPTKILAKEIGSEKIASCILRIHIDTSESFNIFSKYVPENPSKFRLSWSITPQVAVGDSFLEKISVD